MPIELQVLENFAGQRVPAWFPDPERYELSQKEFFYSCEPPEKDPIVRTRGPLAIVELKGFMALKTPRWSRQHGTEAIAQAIVDISAEEGITDLRVEADSGGGQSGASAPITEALDIAAGRLESVETWAQGMLCSAAYRAVRKHPIKATHGSWIGSIGVFLRLWDQTRWLEEFWLTTEHIVASGKYKEAWASSGVSEELLENTRSLIVAENRRFQSEVADARSLSLNAEHLEKISEGYVFDAEGALAAGLIDTVESRPFFSQSTEVVKETRMATFKETIERWSNGGKESKQTRAAARELASVSKDVLAKYPPAVRTSAEPTFAALLALDLKAGRVPAGEEVETAVALLKKGTDPMELAGQEEKPLSELFLQSLANSEHIAEVLMGEDMATPEGEKTAPKVGESVDAPPGLLAFLKSKCGVTDEALESALARANRK